MIQKYRDGIHKKQNISAFCLKWREYILLYALMEIYIIIRTSYFKKCDGDQLPDDSSRTILDLCCLRSCCKAAQFRILLNCIKHIIVKPSLDYPPDSCSLCGL